MKNIFKISTVTAMMLFLSACGDNTYCDCESDKSSDSNGNNSSLSLKQVGKLNVSSVYDDKTNITAEDMALSNDGKTIFLADGSAGLKVIDVSNASSPKLIASLDDPDDKGENRGGFARRITISPDGKTLYIADGLAGLKIINVSKLSSPKFLGKVDTKGFSHGIAVSGDNKTVYLADNGENNASAGLRIINVSDPLQPFIINDRDEQWATQVALSPDNKRLYVTDKKAGVLVVDATSLSKEIKTLGVYKVTDKGISSDVVISKDGTKAYVANKQVGIKILDISNSSVPKLLSTYDADGATGESVAKSLTLSKDGKKLYIANRKTGIQVLDVSKASSPKLLTTIRTTGTVEDVILSKDGKKLYVANGKEGIKIFSIVK